MQISLKNIAVPLGLFSLFLVYFIFGTGWYEPSQLVIRGKVLSGQGTLVVRWDSGAGYNGYERHKFVLGTPLPKGKDKHSLTIHRSGERSSASLSSDIRVSAIAIDGRNFDLQEIGEQKQIAWDGESLRLTEDNPSLELEVQAKTSLRVDTLTNNNSGKVDIAVNGAVRQRDLYAANEHDTRISFEHWILGKSGEFVVTMNMPRYSLNKVLVRNDARHGNTSIDSISIESSNGSSILYTGNNTSFREVEIPAKEILSQQYFNTVQNALQGVFALLTTWITLAVLRLYRSCGGLAGVFSGRRRVFWLFFCGAMVSYSVWVFLFWPGVSSIDSLKIWRAAVLPDVFLNDHPLLNIILYKYLAHIWNNMAVVPIFHVCMMALLVSYIFYSLHSQNISIYRLLPFYLLLISSIPIGLYNTVLWKDIPFAMLIVFWAYTLADLYRQKKDGCYRLSKEKFLALFLLLAAVGLIRHNGMLYFIVIPGLFFILGLVDRRKVAAIVLSCTLLAVCVFLLMKKVIVIQNANYFVSQGTTFLGSVLDSSLPSLLQRSWDNYWGILDINQLNSKWDLWHFYLRDRFAYTFLTHTQWNDVYPYVAQDHGAAITFLRKIAMMLYWQSYELPWVYLFWNPVYMLLLFPLTLIFFWRFPLAAIFSSLILAQVFVLVSVINVLNWRYYYFVCLAGYFLIPVVLLDIQRRKTCVRNAYIG